TEATGFLGFKTGEQNNPHQASITLDLNSAHLQSLPVSAFLAQGLISQQDGHSSLRIDKISGTLANGQLAGDGSLDLFGTQHYVLQTTLNGIDLDNAFVSSGMKKGEIKGTASLQLDLSGELQPESDRLKNLSGSGQFSATNGRVAKLSQLQIKIE